jgi:CARDB protein
MSLFSTIAGTGLLAFAASAQAVGLIPTPVLNDVAVGANAVFDSGSGYTYSYSLANSARSTGAIANIRLDVTANPQSNALAGSSFGLTIPLGSRRVDYDFLVSRLQSLNFSQTSPGFFQRAALVPFGQDVPGGWNGGLGLGGYASYSITGANRGIAPGTALSGFELRSFGVPTVRKIQVIPFWMHVVSDHDAVTPDDMAAAGQVEQAIVFETVTLGPSGVQFGSFGHWDQLRDDLARAIDLGWISNNKLAKALTDQLAFARQALDAHDFFTARSRLGPVLDTIDNSTAAQRTSEGFSLVALNVQSLIDNTPDNPVEPKLSLTPKTMTLAVGAQQGFTATLIDLANGSRPIPDVSITFHVDSGPNAGNFGRAQTDAEGHASFSYVGSQPGSDTVVASIGRGEITFDDSALVRWTGGTDLVVPLFVPPLLQTEGGRTFYITEQTQNIGNIAAPETVTRYFISPTQILDVSTARALGERTVPPLQPDQISAVKQVSFAIPSDLPAGTYFLAACADSNGVVVELDESNNCSFIKVQGRESFVVPMETPNHPPVCAGAAPSVALLWPPNHQLVSVTIQGVTDPENDPVSVRIAGITQDEPVNGLGDGDTAPDGFGVGTSVALLRAERSGLENGRVYAVSFTASDGKGGACSGTVSVGVPHDQGQGSIPVDDGQSYDSTSP